MGDASYISILLFFAYTWGLGFSLTCFAKPIENFFERNIMRIGIGLAVLPLLSVALSLLRIPVDWRIILALSLIYPAISLFLAVRKGMPKISSALKFTKSNLFFLLVLLMFAFTLFMYVKGSFVYPYLDDDDSWNHAVGVKYVSLEKTVFNPNGGTGYLDPYPPAYDTILGIMKQTSPYMIWTIKFFNSLMISLSILFFYFLARKLTKNSEIALFSAFVLTMLPSYLSHFTWSHALAPAFIIIIFYSFLMLKEDKKWVYASGIAFSSIILLSYDEAIKFFALFAIFLAVSWFHDKKYSLWAAMASIAGGVATLLWFVPLLMRYGGLQNFIGSLFGRNAAISIRGLAGSADRIYTFNDFYVAKMQNMINSPIGVGIVISLLVLLGLGYAAVIQFTRKTGKSKSPDTFNWELVVILWFLFTFLGLYGIPMKLVPFRNWLLLALPLSILAGLGLSLASAVLKKYSSIKLIQPIFILAVAVGIFYTSGLQKYTVNTATWPPGAFWSSMEEIQGHLWLKNFPMGTKVFPLANRAPVIAFDMYTCAWCREENDFRKQSINKSAQGIYDFVKPRGYEYLILEGQYARIHGINATNNKIQDLVQNGNFYPVYQNPGMLVFKIQ